MRGTPLIGALLACTGSISSPPLKPVDPGPPVEPPCEVVEPLPGAPVPMRRLNRTHVEQTVHSVLGVTTTLPVADERLFTYRSNVSASVDSQTVQAYFDWAEAVVKQVSLTPCTRTGCESWLLDDIAPQFFRRPLDASQRARYLTLFNAGTVQGNAVTEGAQWVLEALLQSPSFLYLDEPTTPTGQLDGYAVAARLSLMLWGQNPDAPLLARAQAGELDTENGVAAASAQMLRDARSRTGLAAFVSQWIELERLHQATARLDLVALGAPLLKAMEDEPVDRFRGTLLAGGTLAQLLTSSRTEAAPELLAHYGADVLSTSGIVTELDPSRRAGLLTSPGVMAALAHAGSTSPTVRGYAVLANLLCKPPSPPPAGVNATLPAAQPGLSTRQRLELHFSDPGCSSCHRSMDGMGFAFEHYDELGRWRDVEGGQPINDTATFALQGRDYTVTGGPQLSQLLSGRAEVSECFARQWMRYATGIPEQAVVNCYVKRLGDELNQPQGLERLVVKLASGDYVRRGAAP